MRLQHQRIHTGGAPLTRVPLVWAVAPLALRPAARAGTHSRAAQLCGRECSPVSVPYGMYSACVPYWDLAFVPYWDTLGSAPFWGVLCLCSILGLYIRPILGCTMPSSQTGSRPILGRVSVPYWDILGCRPKLGAVPYWDLLLSHTGIY